MKSKTLHFTCSLLFVAVVLFASDAFALNGTSPQRAEVLEKGVLWVSTGDDIHNTNSGNVGIGTLIPEDKLHVRGEDAALSVERVYSAGGELNLRQSGSDVLTSTFLGGVDFEGQVLGQNAQFARISAHASETNAQRGNIRFWTANGQQLVEQVRITETGSVGIGTTAPQGNVEIHDTDSETNIILSNSGKNGRRWNILSSSDGSPAGEGKFVIEDENAGGMGRFFITPDGNIGVGSLSPQAKLSAAGTILAGSRGDYHSGGVQKVHVADQNGNPTMLAATNSGKRTGWIGVGDLTSLVTDYGDVTVRVNGFWNESDPSVSGTEVIRVTSGGNVGIGTSSPSTQLDVNGNITYRNCLGDNDAHSICPDGINGGQVFSNFWGSGAWRFRDAAHNNQDRVTIDVASGKVGIGTSDPQAKLHVEGNIRIRESDSFELGDGWRRVVSEDNGNGGKDLSFYNTAWANPHGGFTFRQSDGSAIWMKVKNDGNVGIGTISPTQRLDVEGYVKGRSGLCIADDCRTVWPSNGPGGGIEGSGTPRYLTKFTSNTIVGDSVLYEDGNGNIGLGTTSPGARLQVAGSVIFSGLSVEGSGNHGAELRSSDGGSSYLDFANDGAVDYDARLRLASDDALVLEGGNLGLGNVNPSERLEVTGNIKLSGNILSDGDICIGNC
ncbi:hypothetical protein HYW21_03015 [Candidatus Woesearchaeota archaeon]|nr:hypothetical protein [Candidatus Woesearchaeota archaeon]